MASSRLVVLFALLLCACAYVAVVDASCKHDDEDVCTDNGCCWDDNDLCHDCPPGWGTDGKDTEEPEQEPAVDTQTCSDEHASQIVAQLMELFEELPYAKQKGKQFPYHGRKHGEVFAASVKSILGYLSEEGKVSAGINPILLAVAALYHDSGYTRPGAVTRRWVAAANSADGKYTKAILGRGHEKESALQLLEHLDLIRERDLELAQSACFQPKYIFQMILLIQSTSVGEAIFGAAKEAADLIAEMEKEGTDAKSRREQLHIGFVAKQTCAVWNQWVQRTQDKEIRTEEERSFCAKATPLNPPIDYQDAYVAFTLAKSDFGQVHQFGGLCWARNLLMEMLKQCNGLSCIMGNFVDESTERETAQERRGRLTKAFFQDHLGFLGLDWVRWPDAWLSQRFRDRTRRFYYELNKKQTAALVQCLTHRSNKKSGDRYIRKILTSAGAFRSKLCPELNAVVGNGPLCVMDTSYQALMPAPYDPTDLP
eukprot:GILJ01000532.1.p1 GENE.GILJ01000532.1~~GILJ01000532.1.p1  ORF type:complete len:483 (-),score=51.09 GILJ01000532.1:180-1628(-)